MSVIIDVSEQEYKKCLNFATEVSKTTKYYSNSNGSSTDKQINDHCVSKVAEIAVENYLRAKGSWIIKETDFSVYKGSKKSWDSDLIINDDVSVHVKSQNITQAKKYTPSWTFQFGGRTGRKDKLFADPNGIIAFCIVNNKQVDIKHILYADNCFNILRDPIVKHLIGEKKVAYLEDLDKNFNGFVI